MYRITRSLRFPPSGTPARLLLPLRTRVASALYCTKKLRNASEGRQFPTCICVSSLELSVVSRATSTRVTSRWTRKHAPTYRLFAFVASGFAVDRREAWNSFYLSLSRAVQTVISNAGRRVARAQVEQTTEFRNYRARQSVKPPPRRRVPIVKSSRFDVPGSVYPGAVPASSGFGITLPRKMVGVNAQTKALFSVSDRHARLIL